ncbi:MAG: Rpn family recombination-promoting nuclease/putative transposase [Pirellulaceae bacterium]
MLDTIRCRDSLGRYLNVEMQIAVYPGLVQRLAYYACSMYVDQLSKGGNYASLSTSISICLLRNVLFADTDQAHHRFDMRDRESDRRLDNAIEVHTIELTKYNLREETISHASKLEQWAFLLLYAQNYEAETLRRLLPGIEFETAIDTIEIISERTEDKQMYDQREKAQRDYEWALSGAKEEGERLGLEKGERLGLEKGGFVGKIQLLQELLGETQASIAELRSLTSETLSTRLAELQQQLRDRQS